MLNTNRIYNEAGDGAPDFPEGMPTVGGDPIVESGSNSDGEWTRWADGTQQCTSTGVSLIATTSNVRSSGVASSPEASRPTWNYPASFDSAPTATTQFVSTTGTTLDAFTDINSDSGSSTSVEVKALDISGFNSDVSIRAFATGRWK